MPKFRLTLAYDGTGFVGWQRQTNGMSIQALLEDALRELDGDDVTVVGAGRTDAGVHACGQVASLSLRRTLDAATLVRALNARLPGAVRVLDAVAVEDRFHAQFHTRSKTYLYRVWNDTVLSPFERGYVWHVPVPLDRSAMAAAAHLLEGRHDFSAFQAAGSKAAATDRVVFRSRIHVVANGEADDGHAPAGAVQSALGVLMAGRAAALIVYEIAGSGFLRYMVRAIVGTLVEVGRGRQPPDWIAAVLAGRDRAHAGPTAPAEGLFLAGVEYNDGR